MCLVVLMFTKAMYGNNKRAPVVIRPLVSHFPTLGASVYMMIGNCPSVDHGISSPELWRLAALLPYLF
jgi:hypothetical protein